MSKSLNEIVLKLEDLPILLNILYFKNNEIFKIYPYLLRKNIFNISLDKEVKVKLLINKDDYKNIINENNLTKYSDLVPQFNSLRSILIASGFLKIKNWEQIINELNKIKSINPLNGERHSFIGMDTNFFIYRNYSVLKNKYKEDISKFYFVLSRIVKTELTSMRHISNDQLNKLMDSNKDYREIFNEFWNGDTLFTRKKHIGLVEFNKLRKESKCLINNSIEIDNDRDYDFQIIEDVRKQILPQSYNLVLFSSDKQFADHAREPGVKSFYLEIPSLNKMPTEFTGNWKMLCDFLYLNSIYFGAISLRGNKNSIKLYGLWRGKSIKDWDSESIKIQIGSEKITDLLEKQLNIINS